MKMMDMVGTRAAVAGAILALVAGASAANAVTFTGSATGSWTNIQGGGSTTANNDAGGVAQINWGIPAAVSFSNYWRFDGVGSDGAPEWSTTGGDLFSLGTFEYRNGSVSGHTFTGADLSIDLAITSPLSTLDVYSFGFTVINTTNIAPGCCDDIASILNSNSTQSFTYDGVDYTLSLFGFSQDGGANLTTMFNSPEGSFATAELYGKIDVVPPAVPLPAAGWLLVAGLGGLGAMKRRKKAA